VADLNYIDRDLEVKIVGQDATGNSVNYVGADANGNMLVKATSEGPVVPGIVASSSLLIGGQYNTTLPTLTNAQQSSAQFDINGRLLVSNSQIDGYKATYSTSITNLVVAASPTDIFTLTGSATKVIKIIKVSIVGNSTVQSWYDIIFIKRSTDNTGGTFISQTLVSFDSNNIASTATARSYTVNPTVLGTSIGTMSAHKLWFGPIAPGGNQVGSVNEQIFQYGTNSGQAITLRGTSQVLAINLNGVTVPGSTINCSIVYTEE
jgi:hypothetical protein